jgi:hypothetical protein
MVTAMLLASPAPAVPKDQHRRKHDVHDHGQHLHHHAGLHDAGAPQARTQGRERELQCKTRRVPVQIGCAGFGRSGARGNRPHVNSAQEEAGAECH